MPCFPPIHASKYISNCRDQNPSCPVPPHNLSYCKDWSDRISDVRFWESTYTNHFQPPDARVVPNLLPCLDGQIFTRTDIGEPKGTALTSLYKISTSHRDYRPPVALSKKYPSTEGYREPWKTVICRWCGNTKPSQQCNAECGRIEQERDHRLPIHNVIGMYTDCSRENDPRCSPCLGSNQRVPIDPGNRVDKEHFKSVCQPQRNLEPSQARSWGVPPPRNKNTNHRRLICIPQPPPSKDTCSNAHILAGIAEFGTLGNSITQYQKDFGDSGWWPSIEWTFESDPK